MSIHKEEIAQLKLKRSFGGKTSGFSNKQEKSFERAHLSAYLKGHKNFNHGFSGIYPNNLPNTHEVKENWN